MSAHTPWVTVDYHGTPKEGHHGPLTFVETANTTLDCRSVADARLIAAAPDLLASCQMLIRIMEEAADGAFANGNTPESGSPDEGEVLTHARMNDARAAIAKAEHKEG